MTRKVIAPRYLYGGLLGVVCPRRVLMFNDRELYAIAKYVYDCPQRLF